jgi:phospholipase C
MISKHLRCAAAFLTAFTLMTVAPVPGWANGNNNKPSVHHHDRDDAAFYKTSTPIKHIVVIFQENVSFDHYFATYPYSTNTAGEPVFKAKKDTPRTNNLLSAGLLDENPNSAQPFRLDRSEAVTCDQDHNYADEQIAFNHGLMNKFPEAVGVGGPGCQDFSHGPGLVMGYYDGNTVTALWNYAQHFAMSDNSYGTGFGPSTPGALNLVAGTTAGATLVAGSPNGNIAGGLNSGAVIGDPRPAGDDCNPVTKNFISISGTTVGDLLKKKDITWGWFQGGFARTSVDGTGKATCANTGTGLSGTTGDYIAHHEPFQYFVSTQNLHHVPPSDAALIGKDDPANHQYDLTDFWTAVYEGRMPAVSFLKARGFQDGHAGYSNPIDEQIFLVQTLNALQNTPEWKSTAVVIAYDDSDGWYDHQMDPIANQSDVTDDSLTEPGACGSTIPGGVPGRCGYGPRLPLLVISPYAKKNYVDHLITDQSSILRFIEDNWELGRIGGDSTDAKAGPLDGMFDFKDGKSPRVLLDPSTGLVINKKECGDD